MVQTYKNDDANYIAILVLIVNCTFFNVANHVSSNIACHQGLFIYNMTAIDILLFVAYNIRNEQQKNSNNSNKNEVIILRYRYITFWNTIFVVDEFYLNVLKAHVFFMNKNIILGITNEH